MRCKVDRENKLTKKAFIPLQVETETLNIFNNLIFPFYLPFKAHLL